MQCSVHAIGDRANNILLNYYEEAERVNGPRDRRFRIEHAQHLQASDIPRFGQLGVIASMQPYHLSDDGRWAEKRLGPERLKGTYAFRTLLDTGAKLVFGSDWPVAPLDPIYGIYSAVTRRTLDEKHPDGWIPEQKISVEEAVRAYTSTGAYAEFSSEIRGRWSQENWPTSWSSPRTSFVYLPREFATAKVTLTLAGGRKTWPQR